MVVKVAAILTLFVVNVSVADVVKLGADYWYPYNGEPGSSMPGVMIELAEKALAQNQMSLHYEIYPWPRAIHMARQNKLDCIVGTHKEDVPDFIFGEEPYGMEYTYFFVHVNSKWEYKNIDSLKGKVIGTIIGYKYDKSLDDWLKEHAYSVGGEDALKKNILKLINGRLDAVIESKAVMDAKLKELDLVAEVKISGNVAATNSSFIACGPNNTRSRSIVEALDSGIKLLRQTGEMHNILNKYGLSDWK